ncbi:hypothetical protein NF552_23125 (plasmid) [Roseomonas mucosa]|nr:hypothetical protein NF552_23125 [Roseomonas mucosa]
MSHPDDAIEALWKRCVSMAADLDEGLYTMFPRDWEDLSEKLDDVLGEMEALSPVRRQKFADVYEH